MDDPLAGLAPGRAASARASAKVRLRAWRIQTMEQRGWRNSAFRVFPDKTLESILARWPTTSGELRACSGIGKTRQRDWQDIPNPPCVTPLLTALGPRPVAEIGVAAAPANVAPHPAAHAAAAPAAAEPPVTAAGRPRPPAVARAHATAARARRDREAAAASRLRARLTWTDRRYGVPESALRTNVRAYSRMDTNLAYHNIAVRDAPASRPRPAAPSTPPSPHGVRSEVASRDARRRSGRGPRSPSTTNLHLTRDDGGDSGASLAASAADEGRPAGAPLERPAPAERPPTSWLGLLGGEVPHRTTAASARYLAMIEAGEVFTGGLGARVRRELDGRSSGYLAVPNRWPPHLEEGIGSTTVFVQDNDDDPLPWSRITPEWARQHAIRHMPSATLPRDLEDVPIVVRITPPEFCQLRDIRYYHLYGQGDWASLLGSSPLSDPSDAGSDSDCVLIEPPPSAPATAAPGSPPSTRTTGRSSPDPKGTSPTGVTGPPRRAPPPACPTCGGSLWRPDGTCLVCARDDDRTTAHDAVLMAHWDELFQCTHANCTNEAVDPDNGQHLCSSHADRALLAAMKPAATIDGDTFPDSSRGAPRHFREWQERQDNMIRCAHQRCNHEAAGDHSSEQPLCPRCDLAVGQEANPGAAPWVHGTGGYFVGLRDRTRATWVRTAGMGAETDSIPWEDHLDGFMANATLRACGGECVECYLPLPSLQPHGFVTCAHQQCTQPAGPIDGQEHLCPACDLALTRPGVVPDHLANSELPSYCARVVEDIRRTKPAVHPQLNPHGVTRYYLRRTGQQSGQVLDCDGCTAHPPGPPEESKAPASDPRAAAAPRVVSALNFNRSDHGRRARFQYSGTDFVQALLAPYAPLRPQALMRPGRWQSTAHRAYLAPAGPLVVCIEGNIAAGKSTAGARLAKAGHVVIPEGLDVWGTTLKEFYKSPSRWAFTLQTTILTSMAERRDQALREHAERRVIFFERSPASAALFAATSADNQDMNEDEIAILRRLHQRLSWAADLTILIDTPAAMCWLRQQTRGRDGETVSLPYLIQLDEAHSAAFGSAHRVDGELSADRIERAIMEEVRRRLRSTASGAPASVPDAPI